MKWTEERIQEQLAICSSVATPIPWEWDGRAQGSHLGNTLIALDDDYEGHHEDMAFIEAACNGYEEALREIQRLQKALREHETKS